MQASFKSMLFQRRGLIITKIIYEHNITEVLVQTEERQWFFNFKPLPALFVSKTLLRLISQ